MNSCPIFYKSLFASTASKINVNSWDKCLEAFDAKRYLDSFYLLMDYINPELTPKYANADRTVYKIPHGSIVVTVTLQDGKFHVFAPFLEVNPDSAIPTLRQVCSLNFNNMDLAQIYLNGNQLNFEYNCKINELNPYKIYYIFKEICATGDRYDDEYVTKFGAKRLYQPIIKPFDPPKRETAYHSIQKCIKDALEYIQYFESKRWFSFAWDMAAIVLRQIDYYVHPQGQLKNDLEKAVSDMHAKNPSLSELVTDAKTFLQGLQEMDKDKLIENLYDVETFIPGKRRSELQNIQENLSEVHKRVKEALGSGNYIGVVLDILFNFYNMYYHNNVQENISRLVSGAMESASGKSWEEGAKTLNGALDKIMSGDITEAKKGLLSRLFGKN